jgi:hypothetical protein
MKLSTQIFRCTAFCAVLIPLCAAGQEVRVGGPAPAFTATDSRGQAESLAQFRGKYVVLEWHNQAARSPESTTSPETCRHCKRSGPRREWSGSP